MKYLGSFNADDEIVFYWGTNDGDGASITRATDGTVKVRRGDGTDVTGTSVTDNEDTPDVGIHECKVDTSDGVNYTAGYDYLVWLDGAVIDGQTVNAPLAMFSLGNRPLQGAGAVTENIYIKDGDSNPLDGVSVWITSDSAGSHIVAGTQTTDATGLVTFYLDAGTYYVWRQLSGYTFTNPQTLTVS